MEELSELKGRLERLDGVSGEELGPVASGSGSGWSERLERLQVTELDIDQPQKGEGVASQGLGTDQQRSKDPTRPLTDLDARLAALEGAMGQVDTQVSTLTHRLFCAGGWERFPLTIRHPSSPQSTA